MGAPSRVVADTWLARFTVLPVAPALKTGSQTPTTGFTKVTVYGCHVSSVLAVVLAPSSNTHAVSLGPGAWSQDVSTFPFVSVPVGGMTIACVWFGAVQATEAPIVYA